VFSWPAAFITGIMGTAPEMALLSALLFLFGPLFGFIMLIVGIIQLIAKKGEK
jgi:ABC-type multidrug transport system permease subunit